MDQREQSDLERRVQAHEALLTSLIAAVGREHPAILTQLESMFVANRAGAADLRPDTLDHAEQVLRIARRQVGAN